MMLGTRFLVGLAVSSLPLSAQGTLLVSLDSGGVQGNQHSYSALSSMDGRFVAFSSNATNLVAGDTNGALDTFVRDLQAGTTERVSVSTAGAQADGGSNPVAITPDGRFVLFLSWATNLVAGDTNATQDAYLRDRVAGTTERVSLGTGGVQPTNYSGSASISADGRYVAFANLSANLVAGDTNNASDVFLRDRTAGTTVLVSLDSAGVLGNGFSNSASISADGRFVAFSSQANNLVAGDTNVADDIFVRDLQAGTTERVSVSTAGAEASWISRLPTISADGRWVAFESSAVNLSPADANSLYDIYVHDRLTGTTELASANSGGIVGDAGSVFASIALDGSCVTFSSQATNLVPGDGNGTWDVFVHDLQSGGTIRVSTGPGGVQGNGASQGASFSGDGRFVCFQSAASNLVAGDNNARDDVFRCDRIVAGYQSLCEPGSGGTIACPCANPPAGSRRGCNNSAATGGAALAVDGLATVGADTLVFTTSGETPIATSILLQGDGANPAGNVLGQGVRCVFGTIKRLYVKTAVAGAIGAPAPGDPTISARSAALGDPIVPVTTRWYMVYYRDPTVLGVCPATSTYNATQAIAIGWWP